MGMGVGGVGTARAVQTAAPAGPLTLRCSDCGQLFPTREARVAHQLLSSAPYKLSWPETCVPVWPEEPSANGAAGASAAPSGVATDGSAFATAPKHGVRMLRSMLEVQMAMPAILAEPLTAIEVHCLEQLATRLAECRTRGNAVAGLLLEFSRASDGATL